MKVDRFATRKEDIDIADKRKKVMMYNSSTPQPLFVEESGRQKKLGELNKGDLVFILNEDNGVVNFHVIKFADLAPENQWLIFVANKSSFVPHEVKTETLANVDGDNSVVDKDGKSPSVKKMKNNYTIPLVAGIGGGFIGFLAARRANQNGTANQNPFVWAAAGVVVFAALGYIATQMEKKKSVSPDLSGSTVTIPDSK